MSEHYPIEVQRLSLDHKGGTKSYHFVMITNAAGKATLIFRWGKTGSFGDIKVEYFDNKNDANNAFEKKFKQKSGGGGYRHSSDKVDSAESEAGLRKILGRALMPHLEAEDIRHVDPNFDTTGMKKRQPPRLDEDGKLDQRTLQAQRDKERAAAREAMAKAAEQEKKEAESHYADNPIYGAF